MCLVNESTPGVAVCMPLQPEGALSKQTSLSFGNNWVCSSLKHFTLLTVLAWCFLNNVFCSCFEKVSENFQGNDKKEIILRVCKEEKCVINSYYIAQLIYNCSRTNKKLQKITWYHIWYRYKYDIKTITYNLCKCYSIRKTSPQCFSGLLRVCACVCSHVCGHLCACWSWQVWVWRPEIEVRCSPPFSLHYFFNQGRVLYRTWNWPVPVHASVSPVVGWQAVATPAWLLSGFWGFKLDSLCLHSKCFIY